MLKESFGKTAILKLHFDSASTLTLQTYSEEKRARVCQMWLRTGSVRTKRTVREILAEASTAADGVLWREPSDFNRCGFATLG